MFVGFEFVCYVLVLVECWYVGVFDCGDVYEGIVVVVIWCDEVIVFVGVEEFDGFGDSYEVVFFFEG